MITALLDTNVFVQSLLSTSRAASSRVVEALYDRRFRAVFSDATLDELLEVLAVQQMSESHGLTDDEILIFLTSFLPDAIRYRSVPNVTARVKDITDVKFLSLAAHSKADYLVTNDRRHLIPIGQFRATRIVLPAEFLRILADNEMLRGRNS